MTHKLLGKCPVCENEMAVTRLSCDNCNSELSGHFHPCMFCRLDLEQEKLLTVFLRARGNIREVEREMGISYPTVRSRLEDLVKFLGLMPAAEKTAEVTG